MSFLSRFRILTKILTIILVLSAISAGISWFGIHALGSLSEDAATMDSAARRAVQAARANTSLLSMNQAEFSIALDPRAANRAAMRKVIDEQLKLFNERIEYAGKTRDEQVKALIPAVKEAMADYLKGMENTLRLAEGFTDAQFSEQAENLRASAMKSQAAADNLRGMIRNVFEQLNARVDHSAKAATEEYETTSRWLIIAALASVLLGLSAGFMVGQFGVARPMRSLVALLQRLARGEEVEVTGTERQDEIGETARAVDGIKVMLADRAQKEAEAKVRQDQVAAEQRKADMIKLADRFESAVGEIIETVSSASTQLEASAETLTSTAVRAQELTSAVAAASEEASANVQSVASATEEMSSSVNEISRQVQESARIADEAVEQAQKTNQRVGQLSTAASRIGDVVELINTIAGQTNLLALNATIEAARAGDAGRGFAVVASEVKALAEQTAKATGEISLQIKGIQDATDESVEAIKEIGNTIGRMAEIASTIASSVEEQGAATQEIARNVQQAAQGTEQVSSNITDVQRSAGETGTASSQVLSAAQSLASESNRLKLEVDKFLDTVRVA
jgi:methyl-accepting chemotaxis protein